MMGLVKTSKEWCRVPCRLQPTGLFLTPMFRFMPMYACHYDIPLERPEMPLPLWKPYPYSNQLRKGLKQECPESQSTNAEDKCPPAATGLVVRSRAWKLLLYRCCRCGCAQSATCRPTSIATGTATGNGPSFTRTKEPPARASGGRLCIWNISGWHHKCHAVGSDGRLPDRGA